MPPLTLKRAVSRWSLRTRHCLRPTGHTTGAWSTLYSPSFGPSPIGLVGKLPWFVFGFDSLCLVALRSPKVSCHLKLHQESDALRLILCAQRMLCILHFQTSKRENVFFPLSFSLICSVKQSGSAPATTILGKAKELQKERDAASPLALFEENAEKKTSFAQVFFTSCSLTSKRAFFPRRHSGRKADHYISCHQSRREASYLSLIHLTGQGRERK